MPSRIRKLQKHRKLTNRKNKKNKTRLTKMRGGAAMPALIPSCSRLGDDNLIPNGLVYSAYLTELPYIQNQAQGSGQGYVLDHKHNRVLAYSDHAPIVYDLSHNPIINKYITIITWNVGQYGNQYHAATNTYNHKFNMQEVETLENYQIRLNNIVNAMVVMLNYQGQRQGDNHPFLFCQELPHLYRGNIDPNQLNTYFTSALRSAGLGILRDLSKLNEFGLIVKMGTNSQRFFVLNKNEYWDLTYERRDGSPGFLIFPRDRDEQDWRKFEIYYYEYPDRRGIIYYYYYVNIHAKHEPDESIAPEYILGFLKKIIDVIHRYRQTRGGSINNVTIYIIGDYNFNIASERPEGRLMRSTLENEDTNNLERKILNMHTFTTQNASGYSLADNNGNRNRCNVDCMLKVDLEEP